MNIHLSGKKYNCSTKKIILPAAGLLPIIAFAKGPKVASEASNPFAIAMMAIAIILLLAIYITSRLLIQQARVKVERFKKEQKENLAKAGGVAIVLLLCLLSGSVFAQDAAAMDAAAKAAVPVALSDTSFYALCTVIGAELIMLLALLSQLKAMMKAEETVLAASAAVAADAVAVPKESSFIKWWENINSLRPIQEESTIDLGHNYDGIRELDNRLPPWWLYGFYLCIIFACVYLWRTEVSHTAPSTIEEYRASVAEAAVANEAYLAKSKSGVDESSVKFLTDASDMASGKKIFTAACAACHLADGGGIVGPNLTDDYWIHGGSIQDIFKTIKYGWPEKGMKSWKDDYSPLQIEQLSSFVKSLHGTKPATPKEPQGELFKENSSAPATDSLKKDSTKITASLR